MNLLMFNLATDSEHVTLAFGLRWIEELSKRFTHIDVITMFEGKHNLPKNVTVWSVGREKGFPKWYRFFRFYWLIACIYRIRKPNVAFAHMIPLFSLLFAPVAFITRCPSVMWYAHKATPITLKLAHIAVHKVITSTKEGFRINSNKLTITGQGVDLSKFPYKPRIRSGIIKIITVGRTAPSKNLHLILEALQHWSPPNNQPWELTIIGGATNKLESQYQVETIALCNRLDLFKQVKFMGRLDPNKIEEHLKQSDIFLSLATNGSLDKSFVESMASGCPVLSSNDSFIAIANRNNLHECIIGNSINEINEGLTSYFNLDPSQQEAIAIKQSKIAINDHGLDELMGKLEDILKSQVQ